MGVLCFNYSLYYSLITQEEIEKIKELRPNRTNLVINTISRICISYGKPFKNITDKDLQDEIIDWVFTRGVTSREGIQNIRFSLGYTIKAKIKSQSQSMYLVEKYPFLTREIQDFQIHLKNEGYASNTIRKKNSSLATFLSFLVEQEVELRQFNKYDFLKYRDWLSCRYKNPSVIYNKVIETKLFIEWGLNDYPSFPKVIDCPNKLLASLNKASVDHNDNNDGLAFPIENLANIIISKCYDYSPKTEIEALCRDFWLIVGTCPVRFEFAISLSHDCLQPMLNDDRLLGLISDYRDKAGNIHGHFPFLIKLEFKLSEDSKKGA